VASLINVKITVEDMTDGLKKAFISETLKKSTRCWNIDKRVKYKAILNKVLYEIAICIDETNKEYIKDFSSAKEV
jgi:hypothetical protein